MSVSLSAEYVDKGWVIEEMMPAQPGWRIAWGSEAEGNRYVCPLAGWIRLRRGESVSSDINVLILPLFPDEHGLLDAPGEDEKYELLAPPLHGVSEETLQRIARELERRGIE